MHDCGGLIEGYLWSESPEDPTPKYNAAQDLSANQMRDICTKSGNISSIPEVPGILVFYDGHAGVYIGGGEVIEARGHAYGVVQTKLKDRPWESWGYYPLISYDEEEPVKQKTITISLPVLKKGAKGDAVQAMQYLLIGYGYDMEGYGADGSFGGATERALKTFQKANGLEADGSCGPATWAKLLGV